MSLVSGEIGYLAFTNRDKSDGRLNSESLYVSVVDTSLDFFHFHDCLWFDSPGRMITLAVASFFTHTKIRDKEIPLRYRT